MRIIFSAVLSNPPFTPGSVLARLHYLRGLRDIGHDVYFVEETYEGQCVDTVGSPCSFEKSLNTELFSNTMKSVGFEDRSCLVYEGGEETFGMPYRRILEIARGTDLLINMSGHLSNGPLLEAPSCRMYLDEDPVYTQLWHSEYGIDLNFEHHDVFATRGPNIGTEASPIPDCSIDWIPALPPVFIPENWSEPTSEAPLTTVASWDVFGDLEYGGEWYGSRRTELVRFAALPSLAGGNFEMMVKAYAHQDTEMSALLTDGGWRLADSAAISDLDGYHSYIDASRGEIGIAKNAYVKGRSGWFSERSAEYLAAGRPVIAQSTGFERLLPTGSGLHSFSTLEDAVGAVEALDADLARQAGAAREIAETYLSHRKVLPALIEAARVKAG